MTIGYYSPTGPDTSGFVSTPTPCCGCGQDLRGLRDTNRCPKCGLPVGRTVQQGSLRFAPPAWLSTVRSGLLLEFWAIIVGVILLVLAGAGLIVWTIKATKSGSAPDVQGLIASSPFVTIAGPIIGVIFGALLTYGIWLITTPEPQPGAAPDGPKTRNATRAIAIFSLSLGAISGALQVSGLLKNYFLVAGVIQVITTLIGAAQFVLLLLVMSELSAMVPDISLASRARITAWCGGIGIALIGLIQLVLAAMIGDPQAFAARRSAPGAVFMAAGCVNALVGLFVFVCYIFFVVTLAQLAGRVRKAREHSESILQQPLVQPSAPQPETPGL